MHLEHVNLTVSDLDRSVEFYREVFGLRERWRGQRQTGDEAVHLGLEDFYLALFQGTEAGRALIDYDHVGFNHLGIVVDDLEPVRERLEAVGGHVHLEGDYEPGRRLYFFDPDGHEVEVVSYS